YPHATPHISTILNQSRSRASSIKACPHQKSSPLLCPTHANACAPPITTHSGFPNLPFRSERGERREADVCINLLNSLYFGTPHGTCQWGGEQPLMNLSAAATNKIVC